MPMHYLGRLLKQGFAAAALVLGLSLQVQAHPHVWVTFETTLLYEQGAFTGLRHKWSFDEFYTAMAIEGLDKNKDGKYDRSELAELAKVNVEALKDFDYFTFPALAGQPLKVGAVRDYWLEHTDGVLSLHFTLPFASPVLSEAKGLTFSVQDPTYFIAFDLAKTANPVRLGEGAPKGCALKIGTAEGDRQTSALEAFSSLGGVRTLEANTVAVECQAGVAMPAPAGQPAPEGSALPKIASADPSAQAKGPPVPSAAVAPPQPEPGASAPAAKTPGALQRTGQWVMQQQAWAHREMESAVRRFRSADPFSAALLLAAISFVYGVLHAAGPGHGKAVISSYVLADGQTVRRGIALSFLAALIQALSAVVLVAVLIVLLRSTGLHMRAMEAWLETLSWGLVALVGVWLIYYQLRTARAPAHAHAGGHAGDHGHHHHGHAHHGHHHTHHHDTSCEACAHLPAASELKGDWSWRRAFALAFAVGIRPCTGAILVLVFAIGQGLWWAGVFSTLAMALGTAITVSVLAAMAVGFRELAARVAGSGSSKWAGRVQMAAGLGGAGLVLVLGTAFFVGSLGNMQPF
jgi:ABC-type nickel/cobalt efflux system permease component RcnA/ABC-type uncharacterized transport system substrate-binding protein